MGYWRDQEDGIREGEPNPFRRERFREKERETEERASLCLTRGNEEAGLLRLTEEASLCFPSFFIIF